MRKILYITAVLLLLHTLSGPGETNLEAARPYLAGPVADHSEEIPVNSSWGPPGEYFLDAGSGPLLVPFPEFEGDDLVMASLDGDTSTFHIRIRSSSDERTLDGTILMGENLLEEGGSQGVILRDINGNIYGIPVGTGNGSPVFVREQHVIYEDLSGDVAIGDVTGDDIPDLLHLTDEGGTLEFLEGPHPTIQGKASLPLPLSMDRIISGPDLTGDGISEIVMWSSAGGNSTVMIFYGYTLAPMAVLDLGYDIGSIIHGDIDSSGRDDLVIRPVTHDGMGKLIILPGESILNGNDMSVLVTSIKGNSSHDLNGVGSICRDLDCDGKDDIVLGLPSHGGGRGRLMVFSGDSIELVSGGEVQPDPVVDLEGESLSDGLGKALFSVDDLNGDLLPDLIIGSGSGPRMLEFGSNTIPHTISDVRFTDTKTDLSIVHAEEGGGAGILCIAEGGDPYQPDILMAEIRTEREVSATRSRVYLRETGNDTGIFQGRILFLKGSIQGRSIGVVQNDVVSLTVLTSEPVSLLIRGFEDQEDDPFLLEGRTEIGMMEDSYLEEKLVILDPDGDNISFEMVRRPDWISVEGPSRENGTYVMRMTGTPDNSHVGWNNLTFSANSNGSEKAFTISIMVKNRIPIIIALDVPEEIVEGSGYRAFFDTGDTGFGVKANISVEGSDRTSWLEYRMSGEAAGIPSNADVGNWTFNFTVDDGNGGTDWYLWNVSVRNVAPVLVIPDITEVMEKEELVLDFDSDSEGDGLTTYLIHAGGMIDPVTNDDGRITLVPDITYEDSIRVQVWIDDGNGGNDNATLEIGIINAPAVLLNPEILPGRLIAGTVYTFDLESDEEGESEGTVSRFHYIFPDVEILGENPERSVSGRFEVRPWNRDAGNHSIKITLEDWNNDSPTVILWNFTVLTDLGFEDPYMEIDIIGRKGSNVVVDLELGGSLPFIKISPGLSFSGGMAGSPSQTVDLRSGGRVELDMEMSMEGSEEVMVLAWLENSGNQTRMLNITRDFEWYSLENLEDNEKGSILPFIVILIIMIILVSAAISLFIERTSYPIASLIFRGGKIEEESVMRLIQDRPGLGFHDLIRERSVPLRDMVATLDHLERKGMARAVINGPHVNFLPMMGSFVDGPLALNRYQKMILEMLNGSSRMNTEDISKKTGFPIKRTGRELKMLELKGAVKATGSGEGTMYQLTRRQKLRMRD